MTVSTRHVQGCGTVEWRLPNGEPHRVDGPAIVVPGRHEEWLQHGVLHREDGPAIVWEDGREQWWQDGVQHRDGGPAVTWEDGAGEWWLYGERHRVDGPAITEPHEQWYIEGYLVDVDRWNFDVMGMMKATYVDVDPDEPPSGEVLQKLADPEFDCYDTLVAFRYVMNNLSTEMLTHGNRCVAAIAAWHHPVDDDYIAAAFRNSAVRSVMRHRSDAPEHVETLFEVAL